MEYWKVVEREEKKGALWRSWLLFKRGGISVKAWLKHHFLEINLVFSNFGEKAFWWNQRENTFPSFIFLSSHLIKHTLKKFSFLFSLQNFSFTLFHF